MPRTNVKKELPSARSSRRTSAKAGRRSKVERSPEFEQLLSIIENSGFSDHELSKMTNYKVNQATYWWWRRGTTRNPRFNTMKITANALGYSFLLSKSNTAAVVSIKRVRKY